LEVGEAGSDVHSTRADWPPRNRDKSRRLLCCKNFSCPIALGSRKVPICDDPQRKEAVGVKARQVLVAAAALFVLAGCGTSSAEASNQGPAKPGAEQVVDAIAAKWPVPDQKDETSACKGKDGANALGCVKLVTTGTVSVYEFADEAGAKNFATQMKVTGGDWRPAGRFVLAWTTDEQKKTSADEKTDMVNIASVTN
jgi:hypothetical protein